MDILIYGPAAFLSENEWVLYSLILIEVVLIIFVCCRYFSCEPFWMVILTVNPISIGVLAVITFQPFALLATLLIFSAAFMIGYFGVKMRNKS